MKCLKQLKASVLPSVVKLAYKCETGKGFANSVFPLLKAKKKNEIKDLFSIFQVSKHIDDMYMRKNNEHGLYLSLLQKRVRKASVMRLHSFGCRPSSRGAYLLTWPYRFA